MKKKPCWGVSTRAQLKIALLYKRVLLGREGRKKQCEYALRLMNKL